MGKKRLIGGLIAAVATAAVLAVPAFAATPSQIYKDYADNGRLDAKYSAADLQRALHDASVQGYGNPVVVAKMKQKPKRKGGVQGGKAGGASPASGGLPFTGAQLGLFMVVGLSLVGSGLLLRITGRKKSEKSG
jgi:opacity protein-like surface antigen